LSKNYDDLCSNNSPETKRFAQLLDEISNEMKEKEQVNSSVYDVGFEEEPVKFDIYKQQTDPSDTDKKGFSSSLASLTQSSGPNPDKNLNANDDNSYKLERDFDNSSQKTTSTSKTNFQENSENYLDCVIDVENLKQDIRLAFYLDYVTFKSV
jgi:hypothetical protein